jgi:muramoyltetrapeptide carboxypeptidase
MPSCYVCCPAYALDGPLKRSRILEAVAQVARPLEYTVVSSPLMDRHMGAGAWLPEAERRRDLDRALEHDLVWAAIGGYGSIHLAEHLLARRAPARCRLVGYSDLTVLHAVWRARGWGEGCYAALPGPAVSRATTSLLALIRGQGFERDGSIDAGVRVLRAGQARGSCFTACVSVLAGLCGTPVLPDLQGCILAIEDVDERPFQLDFALMQLHLAGALAGVVGLVGGNFHHKERPDYDGPTADEVLAAWAHRLRVPGLSRMPFGHLDDGLAMPCGRAVALDCREDGSWRLTVLPDAGAP